MADMDLWNSGQRLLSPQKWGVTSHFPRLMSSHRWDNFTEGAKMMGKEVVVRTSLPMPKRASSTDLSRENNFKSIFYWFSYFFLPFLSSILSSIFFFCMKYLLSAYYMSDFQYLWIRSVDKYEMGHLLFTIKWTWTLTFSRSWFELQVSCMLTIWICYLTTLCFSFLICKMGTVLHISQGHC